MGETKKFSLLFGTTNAGKLAAMRNYLRGMDEVELIGLGDLPLRVLEPEENGRDMMENARKKALYYCAAFQRPVISADSGLYIEGLPEEEQPGAFVRRVGGRALTDGEMRAHYKGIAKRLGGRCVAQYRNAVCLAFSEEEIYCSQDGDLAWEKFYLCQDERPQRIEGFPLDAISQEYPSGRHFYDIGEWTPVEEDGAGFRRFLKEALRAHAAKIAEKKRMEHDGTDLL